MSGMPSLWTQFQGLKPSADAEGISAIRCGVEGQHLLVRGERGEPALLLASELRTSPRADVRLKHVGVQFDRKFEITHNDGGNKEVGSFCKFTCDPSASHLHQYFVELMAATANAHVGFLSPPEIDEVVNVLLELFRKLSPPTEGVAKGLWGELLLIQLAASPGKFVDAWHVQTTDGFDFAFKDMRIEVKTTERSSRQHEFSLRQVRQNRPTDLVASICLSRSSAGVSALDLARMVADRLNVSQQEKLWRLVVETVGDDADGEQRFDLKSASDALIFVHAVDVPSPEISKEMTPFISEVRFLSDINLLCATSALKNALILDW